MFSIITSLMSSAGGIIAMLAVVAGLVGSGAYVEHQVDEGTIQSMKVAEATAAQQAEAKALAQQQAYTSIANAAAQKQTADQQEISNGIQTSLAAVAPVVKTVATNCVPYGLVRVLDAAASGRNPADLSYPTGQSDNACAPTSWAAVGRSVVANYYTARANADQLTGLVGFFEAAQKAQVK